MTNGREIKPQRVPLTIYENTEGKFPTLLIQILIIIGFGLAILVSASFYNMRWNIGAVSYRWEDVLEMSDVSSAIMIKEDYTGSDEKYRIYDEEHKNTKGGRWKYGVASPNATYIATGKLFEGKYPEIYLDKKRTRIAYIDIDFSAPENRNKTNCIGIE